MNKYEAKLLAETVSVEDIKQMFINAQEQITDWSKPCRVNKGFSLGAAFNMFTACKIDENLKGIAKKNFIWGFGEYLPNYQPLKRKLRPEIPVYHEEPVKINFDN